MKTLTTSPEFVTFDSINTHMECITGAPEEVREVERLDKLVDPYTGIEIPDGAWVPAVGGLLAGILVGMAITFIWLCGCYYMGRPKGVTQNLPESKPTVDLFPDANHKSLNATNTSMSKPTWNQAIKSYRVKKEPRLKNSPDKF